MEPSVTAEQIKMLDYIANESSRPASHGPLAIAEGKAIRSLLTSYLLSLAEVARLETVIDRYNTLVRMCPNCNKYDLDPEYQCFCTVTTDGSDL